MVWVSWHLRPSWFPKTHCQQSSPSRDTLHIDGSLRGREGFATHEGSNWWIFCWIFIRLSLGSPGSPYCWHARQPPRIAKNWSLERFGTAKIAFAAVPKKTGGAEVYQSTCAFHQNHIFFSGQMDATLSQTVKWSHTWVLQPLVCRMRGTTSGLRFQSMWKKSYLLSIAVPFWCGSVEQKKCWTVHSGVAWISDIGWA